MLFSPQFKARFELLTLSFGVSTFVLHALIIFLLKWGWVDPQYFPRICSEILFPPCFLPLALCWCTKCIC
jgi:hypothetical protein